MFDILAWRRWPHCTPKPILDSVIRTAAVGLVLSSTLQVAAADSIFTPGNLILSRSVYTGDASTVTIGQKLPPACPSTASCGNGLATDNGAYPAIGSTNNVWNNDLVDGSFGITSPIFLDQITTGGTLISTFPVDPNVIVTSFSSKSELALNLSGDGSAVTFMGYITTPNNIDVSNSNTPGVYDPTSPVGISVYRAVAQLDGSGDLSVTNTNAYSGNNGRAAAVANGFYYTVGNSNNGSGTPANVVAAAGVQLVTPGQPAGNPVQIGNFSISQVINPDTGLPYPPDKAGKDNNFRGLTIFNNTLYVSKGSGSNGINTVYQVGSSGVLPTPSDAAGTPITILPGFPVILAKNAAATNPFGLWFANANTLYVADEGDGTTANAGISKAAGLQKWTLVNGTWHLNYVLQNGLNLGKPYSVANYPASLNPATDGLRNITGRVNADGTVTIWGVTSTVSSNGDQGADPNKLVSITDVLANTDPGVAAGETFNEIRAASYGEVLRGVCFTPGTTFSSAPAIPVTASGLTYSRRTGTYNGTLTITNNSASALNGPIAVSITQLTPGVTVIGGSTITVLPGGGSLAPGQSASATISLVNPANVLIQFTPIVEP